EPGASRRGLHRASRRASVRPRHLHGWSCGRAQRHPDRRPLGDEGPGFPRPPSLATTGVTSHLPERTVLLRGRRTLHATSAIRGVPCLPPTPKDCCLRQLALDRSWTRGENAGLELAVSPTHGNEPTP